MPPEWLNPENANPCPVDGCDGHWWTDVGGSAAYPVTEYHTDCRHRVEKCCVCNASFDRTEGRRYDWPVDDLRGGPGHQSVRWFCHGCHTPENVNDTVPSGVIDG